MSRTKQLQANWDKLGQIDPLWAVLTDPGKENRQWNVDEFFETGEREIKVVLDRLDSLHMNIGWSTALDFGCAVGRLTQALATRFDQVSGVDIAPSMIEQANQFNKHGHRCRYILNEVDHLSVFADDYFDFVYSNITLQHMHPKYIRKYLTEFARVLKPGGAMVFQLPSERSRGTTPIKRFVRLVVPEYVIDWIFHARVRLTALSRGLPVMEMYGIRQEKVVDFLSKIDVETAALENVSQSDSVWLSYRYYATKGGMKLSPQQ